MCDGMGLAGGVAVSLQQDHNSCVVLIAWQRKVRSRRCIVGQSLADDRARRTGCPGRRIRGRGAAGDIRSRVRIRRSLHADMHEIVEQRGVYNVFMFYVEGGTPSIYSRGVTLVSECIVNRWITCMDA